MEFPNKGCKALTLPAADAAVSVFPSGTFVLDDNDDLWIHDGTTAGGNAVGGAGGGAGGAAVTISATEPEGTLTGTTGDMCAVVVTGVLQGIRVKTTASGNTGWV